ncbi:hypothetical protein HDV02_005618 [Globomyces sp. JEL0801]|nr:hypothetical protein HDV02_005618 [Globomyces sp. JEL0801]
MKIHSHINYVQFIVDVATYYLLAGSNQIKKNSNENVHVGSEKPHVKDNVDEIGFWKSLFPSSVMEVESNAKESVLEIHEQLKLKESVIEESSFWSSLFPSDMEKKSIEKSDTKSNEKMDTKSSAKSDTKSNGNIDTNSPLKTDDMKAKNIKSNNKESQSEMNAKQPQTESIHDRSSESRLKDTKEYSIWNFLVQSDTVEEETTQTDNTQESLLNTIPPATHESLKVLETVKSVFNTFLGYSFWVSNEILQTIVVSTEQSEPTKIDNSNRMPMVETITSVIMEDSSDDIQLQDPIDQKSWMSYFMPVESTTDTEKIRKSSIFDTFVDVLLPKEMDMSESNEQQATPRSTEKQQQTKVDKQLNEVIGNVTVALPVISDTPDGLDNFKNCAHSTDFNIGPFPVTYEDSLKERLGSLILAYHSIKDLPDPEMNEIKEEILSVMLEHQKHQFENVQTGFDEPMQKDTGSLKKDAATFVSEENDNIHVKSNLNTVESQDPVRNIDTFLNEAIMKIFNEVMVSDTLEDSKKMDFPDTKLSESSATFKSKINDKPNVDDFSEPYSQSFYSQLIKSIMVADSAETEENTDKSETIMDSLMDNPDIFELFKEMISYVEKPIHTAAQISDDMKKSIEKTLEHVLVQKVDEIETGTKHRNVEKVNYSKILKHAWDQFGQITENVVNIGNDVSAKVLNTASSMLVKD